ncbi:putative DNA replication protein [Listeria phage LP-030-3]|uniref:Putative DNA replication protein n=1 Tax=Listeria phage LP-030-3 TaxID=1458852 RepID=A0A059T6C3_9CAUD|nr:putative DNA replication protein [Listeria phage LP-030-3]AHL18707.1 putative DNA replication protein [Listeria phage LP-030-3]
MQIEDLMQWKDDLGEELVIFAVEHAAMKSAKYYGFVQNLLKDWAKQNINTIEKAKNYEEQRKVGNKQQGGVENEFTRKEQNYSW